MKVRFMLARVCAVVLKHVHSDGAKRLCGSFAYVSHKGVHGFDLSGLDVEDGFSMTSGDDQHRSTFILPLVHFRNRIFVLGNERACP